jgi:2-oxoglutarate ferredoxin oxidoreductase subunit alpha
LISEGRYSVNPEELDFFPVIERGETITEPSIGGSGYHRYKFTESGVSPRAVAGLEGYIHVVATDEHEENSGLISDEFTNPHKRRAMVEKRSRKFDNIVDQIDPPELIGDADAEVTLVGWGSTFAAMHDAVPLLAEQGIKVNYLPIKWIVPLHADKITEVFTNAKRTIMVENNQSGQFARYLRSETGLTAHGHIRKYDGEPFMPHHIVDGVMDHINNANEQYIPYQEIVV